MKSYNLAIVGATGLVGQELLKTLEQRKLPLSSIKLLASDRSAGKKVYVNNRELEIQETVNHSFQNINIAIFSTMTEVSRHYAPIAVQSGTIVIDNSPAWRLEQDVPLVVPEVNIEDVYNHKGIIANPDCLSIQLAVVLNPLHKLNAIKRIIVDTYQSVSGTGAAGVQELSTQSKLILEGKNPIPHIYPHQIAFNLLPEIDVFMDDDYTKEEWKIVKETRKIMHAPDMQISATCVRVPVFTGSSAAVTAEFSLPIYPDEARKILSRAPGVRLLDDPTVSLYPQPWYSTGSNEVLVGRIRKDISHPNGLVMWIVVDNLRKGSALNAIQILEEMIKRGLI